MFELIIIPTRARYRYRHYMQTFSMYWNTHMRVRIHTRALVHLYMNTGNIRRQNKKNTMCSARKTIHIAPWLGSGLDNNDANSLAERYYV